MSSATAPNQSKPAPDTIAAIASGAGRAGIGVVRVSGPAAVDIAGRVLGEVPSPRQASYGPFLDADGVPLDTGIAILFAAPHSYTGEHVLELQGHGGAVVMDLLLSRVLACGARLARAGEFTERAFLNEKLDLAQAEAVADLIDSSSTAAARAAMQSLQGRFSDDVSALREALIGLRVWIEAALDFSEEEVDFLADRELSQRADQLTTDFERLLRRMAQGQRLREGMRIVIAGRPNVGKSSLLNALSGDETAIVTDIAGTTRDTLHIDITLEGIPFHITDTAGLRETSDFVEQKGIDRAQRAMTGADHTLLMLDATQLDFPDVPVRVDAGLTLVLNKTDLLDSPATLSVLKERVRTVSTGEAAPITADDLATADIIMCSAADGSGLEQLRAHLLMLAGHDQRLETSYSARRRHLDALQAARESMMSALARLEEGVFAELAAEDLRAAQQSLDSILGRFDTEDLLGRIFSDFCIGK